MGQQVRGPESDRGARRVALDWPADPGGSQAGRGMNGAAREVGDDAAGRLVMDRPSPCYARAPRQTSVRRRGAGGYANAGSSGAGMARQCGARIAHHLAKGF